MTIHDLDLVRIRRFVDARNAHIPAGSRQFMRIEAEVGGDDGGDVTILDRRAPWDVDLVGPEWTRKPVARLSYDADQRQWTLYWVDPAQRFRLYDRVPPSAGLTDLLEVIGTDPLTVFWG
jgi:hypothetical protein